MSKFADQLFDDLMREHAPALAAIRVPTVSKRHLATRPALLTAGAGGLAAAAAVGTLVAGGTPAYAVTRHPDGTVTLAVYQKSGIAGANAKLHQVGAGRVVVVPVESGCPSISSLPGPGVPSGHVSHQSGVTAQGGTFTTHGDQGAKDGGKVTKQGGKPSAVPVPGKESVSVMKGKDGSVSVNALSVPAGDTLALAFTATANGMSEGAARLTTGPVPSCVSLPAPPAEEGGHGNVARTGGSTGDSGTVKPDSGSGASAG
jgi:hypothetical protein